MLCSGPQTLASCDIPPGGVAGAPCVRHGLGSDTAYDVLLRVQVGQGWDHSQAGCLFSSPPLAILNANISARSPSSPWFTPPGFLPTHRFRCQQGQILRHVLGDPSDCCLPPAFACPESSCLPEPCAQPALARGENRSQHSMDHTSGLESGMRWEDTEAKVIFGFSVGGGVKAGAPWGPPVQGTR